jgi:hypothetical protein
MRSRGRRAADTDHVFIGSLFVGSRRVGFFVRAVISHASGPGAFSLPAIDQRASVVAAGCSVGRSGTAALGPVALASSMRGAANAARSATGARMTARRYTSPRRHRHGEIRA